MSFTDIVSIKGSPQVYEIAIYGGASSKSQIDIESDMVPSADEGPNVSRRICRLGSSKGSYMLWLLRAWASMDPDVVIVLLVSKLTVELTSFRNAPVGSTDMHASRILVQADAEVTGRGSETIAKPYRICRWSFHSNRTSYLID